MGERQDLRQPVAHIDHGGAGGDDPADDAAQLLDAGNVEARGRFVEQQNLRVCRQCLDDLEELALGGVEMPDERVRRDAERVRSKQPRRPFVLAADGLRAVGDPEDEVLGDGELAHQRVVLIDDGEAELARLQRVGGRERPAHDRHAAFIGGDGAAGNAEKGTFAGAVLAEDGVNLSRPAFEIDPIERLHAGIALRNAGQFERGRAHHPIPESRASILP